MDESEVRAAAAERLRRVKQTSVTDVYGLYTLGPDANDYRQKYASDLLILADAYLELAARPVVPPEVHTVALAIGFSYGCVCPMCTMARFILSLTESKP
jgi:hypothetical protein